MVLRTVLRDVLTNPARGPLDRFGGFLPSQLTGLKAWFRFNSGITVTGAGVSQWDDASGEGNHLLQATDTNRPSKEADGSILFDGVDNYLKCNAFTLVQPETVYFLGRQVFWSTGRRLYDGEAINSGILFNNGVTPEVAIHAGASLPNNSDFVTGTYAVAVSVFNGVSSSLQIDNNTPVTGNVGSDNMGGFTLGASGGITTLFSNIQVKEIAIYNEAHDAATRTKVIAYLSSL